MEAGSQSTDDMPCVHLEGDARGATHVSSRRWRALLDSEYELHGAREGLIRVWS